MELDTQISNIWISIAVLASLAFIWSIIRTWGWNKRSGKINSDIVTVFKFLMYVCGSVGNAFFVVFVGVCIWWLVVFKGQTFAYILTPQESQESVFRLLLIVAFALKALDVIHLIFVQVSYDIFVVDWEKPKVEKGFLKTLFIKLFI
jgi:meckelin